MAPAGRRVLSQARFDTRAVLANGEQLLLTLVLPLLALVGLTRSTFLAVPLPAGADRIDVIAPGVLAVAVLSTSFTSQAIATAFDRRHGVLRLLGTTPLGRGGLVAGRLLAVLAVQLVQLAVLGGTALALGWSPQPAGLPVAALVGLLGTVVFVALGLLLGGTVRAEGVLAIANLVWVLLVVGGGVLLPSAGTGALAPLVRWLPSAALGDGLRQSLLGTGFPWRELVVLGCCAVLATAAARRFFRWQ